MKHINTSGSEWRKWDLHTHTPFTKLNDNFKVNPGDVLISGNPVEKKWEKWFRIISEKGISVVGVTDYFSIDNYNEVITRKNKFSSNVCFLPNIEFRISQQNKDNEFINIHVIFSNSESVVFKINDFLTRLKLISTDDNTLTNKFCTSIDLIEIGYKKAMVELGELEKALSGNFKNIDEYIVVGVARGQGNIRPGRCDDGRGSEYAKEIDKLCNAFFGNKDDVSFYLNKTGTRPKNLIPKPVLWCCDAHEFDAIGDKFTWIKADPSYEGLQQILFESEERVKIQTSNPTYDYNKPYFSEIKIDHEVNIFNYDENQVTFAKTKLPLNKNLVSIIGGRGTGKSMLINYLSNIFYPDEELTQNRSFKIIYAKDNQPVSSIENFKGGDENVLDFIFIPQSNLKDITRKEKIGDEVRKLLQIRDYFFSQELNNKIRDILTEIESINSWFVEEDEEGRKLNNRNFVEEIKRRSIKLLSSITTKDNKEKLERYTQNIAHDVELEKAINELNDLKKETEETISTLNKKIIAFNEGINLTEKNEISEEGVGKEGNSNISDKLKSIDFSKIVEIPLIDFTNQIEIINKNIEEFEILRKFGQAENSDIKKDFEEAGFTGDLKSLLENAENYQSNIKWADNKLETIERNEKQLSKLIEKRSDLGVKIKDEYTRQKKSIDLAWENILAKHNKEQRELIEKILLKEGLIHVKGEILFNKQQFYKLLYNDFVDKRSYKSKSILEERFRIDKFDDWVNFITTELEKLLYEEDAKFPEILNLFFNIRERSKYLTTSPIITYNGKPLDRLSVGQRGTVYLCLKLATDAFSKPIIFDQPEDDLDNKFIVEELVDVFKDLKQYRQIIIVTHNANLVVNSDAEQVIIASNEEEKLSYLSGSLETPQILEEVCKVLEGGTDAFEKRKNKYRLK